MADNGRIVKVSGDYRIVAGQGNSIILDTGPSNGTVKITGDLIVEGTTITVESTTLSVNDNIITLNDGEVGPGVTVEDGFSGLQIQRGSTEQPATFLWNENLETWQLALGLFDTGFDWTKSKLKLKEIITDSSADSGDLMLIGSGTGVVKVLGTVNYEDQVTHDDDIPNKKYVDRAIDTNPSFQIISDNTRVITFDLNDPLDSSYFIPAIGPYSSMPSQNEIAVIVNNRRTAVFRNNQIQFTGLTFFNEDPVVNDVDTNISVTYENEGAVVIQADNTNSNIRLETNGTGKVVIPYAQSFEHHGLSPSAVTSATLIYGATPGSGTTGIRFINTRASKELDGTVNATFTNDELISKNRALLFSMLF